MEEKYVCSMHINEVLNIALSYWELDKNKQWTLLGKNLAYRLTNDIHESLCLNTYPHEAGPRISYVRDSISKSAWIHKSEIDNSYYLIPRVI